MIQKPRRRRRGFVSKRCALLPATGLDGAPGSASASARWPPAEPRPATIKTKLRQTCGEMQCLKRWKLKFLIQNEKPKAFNSGGKIYSQPKKNHLIHTMSEQKKRR